MTTNVPALTLQSSVSFSYNEDRYLAEAHEYIGSTYSQHYSGKVQALDLIEDAGHGMGFVVGSIIKYAARYGKKDGHNRKDLMKILHYTILALFFHDKKQASPK
jgi:hypothetical protein